MSTLSNYILSLQWFSQKFSIRFLWIIYFVQTEYDEPHNTTEYCNIMYTYECKKSAKKE